MGDIIDKVMGQISAYEILNNIIPGAVYAAMVNRLTSIKIFTGRFWVDLIICYFLGLVIGRIGSLFIGEHAKKKNKDKRVYERYLKAEKIDERIRAMSTINNMYRTFISVMICFIVTFGFSFLWPMIGDIIWIRIILIVAGSGFLTYLFQRSYTKQDKFIVKRVNEAIGDDEGQDK